MYIVGCWLLAVGLQFPLGSFCSVEALLFRFDWCWQYIISLSRQSQYRSETKVQSPQAAFTQGTLVQQAGINMQPCLLVCCHMSMGRFDAASALFFLGLLVVFQMAGLLAAHNDQDSSLRLFISTKCIQINHETIGVATSMGVCMVANSKLMETGQSKMVCQPPGCSS